MNWKFSGDRPVYQQIMELMRGGIVKGELPPGGKIPSVRELAAQAQVNPNTMQRAMTELEREGLLVSGGTSGRTVTENPEVLEKMREAVLQELARECGNKKLGWRLKFYRRHPWPLLAKRIAAMLHRTECEEVVDLLSRRLREAVQDYPRRSFGKATDNAIKRLEQQAEERRQELARQGIRAEVLREEPFTIAQDNLEFHVYLMIWETRGRDRRVRIETIK